MQNCGLAASAGAADRDKLSGCDGEVYTAQRFDAAAVVVLGYGAQFELRDYS